MEPRLNRKSAPKAPSVPSEPAEGSERGKSPLESLILRRLEDEKAHEITFIDLEDRSSLADSLVIASGRSRRHVSAMADHLLRALKDAGEGRARVEGVPQCDWVLIDAGDVIVHLFRPEVRSFYNIEKIWAVTSRHRATV